MLPDFTPEIKLESKEARIYQFSRLFVYLASFLAGLYLFFLIFFPSQYFTFIFANPNSLENTLISPRDQMGVFPAKGALDSNQKLLFNAEMKEKYSEVVIEMEMAEKPNPSISGKVNLRKAYQAFLYPEGAPLGFKEGTLVVNGKDYYLVSDNKLRPLSSSLLEKLGFPKKGFVSVSPEDLKYNPLGEAISDSGTYPQSTIFQIENSYYILDQEKLRPFSSVNAYLSQYSPEQAIPKDPSFLANFEIQNDPIGFADGSLVSFGISAFIVSQKNLLPINNVATFESKGFVWDDVSAIGSDEMALYEKQKLFTIQSPHPDGVVFWDSKTDNYFRIENGTKRRIPSENILHGWLKKSPIPASLEALDIFRSCQFSKKRLSLKTAYFCSASIKDLENFPGTGFEFQTDFDSKVKLSAINVTFKKEISSANLKSSLAYFLNSIRNNYGFAQ